MAGGIPLDWLTPYQAFRCQEGRRMHRTGRRENRVRSCNNIVYYYHSLMARPLRLEFPGAVYHFTSCGNARQSV